jgi:hypothetical protein
MFAAGVVVAGEVVVLVPHEEISEESTKATTSKKLKPNHKTFLFIYLFLPFIFCLWFFPLISLSHYFFASFE